MSMTMPEPVSDMFTRIRNALLAKHKIVLVISTKLTCGIATILLQEGFIDSFENNLKRLNSNAPVKFGRFLLISLKYTGILSYRLMRRDPAIEVIQRTSKPGARRYTSYPHTSFFNLVTILNDVTLIILLSTHRGVMTIQEAKELNIGGEIIGFVKTIN